jgi:hypothetical protein
LGTANAAGLLLLAIGGVQELTGVTGSPFLHHLGAALAVALMLPWLVGLAQVAFDRHVRAWRYGVVLLALPAIEFSAMVLWGLLKYGD